MIIEIDLQFLLNNTITAHQYVILKLASDNNHSKLLSYLTATDTHRYLKDDWEYLFDRGFLGGPPDGLVNVNKLRVTSKFIKSTTYTDDPFDEFYKEFPVKVLRPDGAYDYLRVDQKRCRRIYNNLVVNNPDKHNFILKALRKEVALRDAQGKMAFMKRMPSWLTSESWTTFTDMIEDDHGTTPEENNKVAYGTSFE